MRIRCADASDVALLAVALLLSLALHIGLLQRIPTSPCLSHFWNNCLERRTGLFSQVGLLCKVYWNDVNVWWLPNVEANLLKMEAKTSRKAATRTGLSFSCGAQLQDASLPEHLKILSCQMFCEEPREKLYYSAKFTNISYRITHTIQTQHCSCTAQFLHTVKETISAMLSRYCLICLSNVLWGANRNYTIQQSLQTYVFTVLLQFLPGMMRNTV